MPRSHMSQLPAAVKRIKNPKRSVRERYNRRKLWVSEALQELDMAADVVLKQSGPIHKREEAENIRNAIAAFWELTALRPPRETISK